MNDSTDFDNDLEDVSSQLPEEWANNCSPFQLWSLICDIEDGMANKEGVERAMEYYCYLWEKRQAPPPELSKLIVTIFRKYLRGKKANRTLEAAFGFTGKPGGTRNYDQRNLDIATGIARLLLAGKGLDYCLDWTIYECGLGRTTIERIWKKYRSDAISQVREELKAEGRSFTNKQINIALKALKKETKLLEEHNKKLGD